MAAEVTSHLTGLSVLAVDDEKVNLAEGGSVYSLVFQVLGTKRYWLGRNGGVIERWMNL